MFVLYNIIMLTQVQPCVPNLVISSTWVVTLKMNIFIYNFIVKEAITRGSTSNQESVGAALISELSMHQPLYTSCVGPVMVM